MSDRLRYIFILIIICLMTVDPSFGQSLEPNDMLPFDKNVRTGTLPNGLRYYIRVNRKPEKRVELRLAINAGSILEDDNQQGLAHFAEHMCFNGTKRFPKGELVNFLESIGTRFGAHLNAYTSFDETVYMLQLPTDKPGFLERGLDVLEDWGSAVTFDDTEIDKERGVVVEEWRLRRGAGERISNKLLPFIFFRSRYADRLPIGKKEVLDTFHYASIKKFYYDWYRPNLMAVAVVGDIDPDQVEKMITERFARMRNPEKPRERIKFTVPSHNELIVATAVDKELPESSVEIYYKYDDAPRTTVADYRRMIVGALADGMLNNRFAEIVLKDDAPFVRANGSDSYLLGGKRSFSLDITPKDNNILKAFEAGMTELVRLRQHGFTSGELERQKKELFTQIERQYNEREKTDSRVLINQYVRNFLRNDPVPGIEYTYEIYKKYLPLITVAEVNDAVTKRMAATTSKVITVAAPEKPEVSVPTEQQLRAVFSNVDQSQTKPYLDAAVRSSLIEKEIKPGKISQNKLMPSIGTTEWQFSNGVRVVFKPTDFKNDEILFTAFSPGGWSLAPDKIALSAQYADGIIDESGVADLDPTALRKILSGKRVTVSPYINQLYEGFTGNASAADLETAMQLIYLYMTAPRVDKSAFNAFIERMKTRLANRSMSPEGVFSDTVNYVYANYHPRSKPLTIDDLTKIDPDDVLEFFRSRFADASDFTFTFVGKIDVPTFRRLAEKYLGSLPSLKRAEHWKDLGIAPPTGTIERTVRKGVEPKSYVQYMLHGDFSYSLENRLALTAMSEVLSIKLRESLREDKGGVYGVGCRASAVKYPKEKYTVSIGFGCAPERAEELIAEVRVKIDSIRSFLVQEPYIAKVSEIQKREFEVNLKENNFWLNTIAQAYQNGDDPEKIPSRKALIDSLSTQTVFDAAKKYLTKPNQAKFVLLPEK